MTATIKSITKDTLLPIGVVIAMMMGTWTMATDRQATLSQVQTNTATIAQQAARLTQVEQQLNGIDRKLDTIANAVGVKAKETH